MATRLFCPIAETAAVCNLERKESPKNVMDPLGQFSFVPKGVESSSNEDLRLIIFCSLSHNCLNPIKEN